MRFDPNSKGGGSCATSRELATVKSVACIYPLMPIEYDELNSLVQSGNPQISALAEIILNLRDRLEAMEKRQNELLDEIHKLKHHESVG